MLNMPGNTPSSEILYWVERRISGTPHVFEDMMRTASYEVARQCVFMDPQQSSSAQGSN